MKFKMNKDGFTLLVSNMTLGGAYVASCEEKYDIPKKERDGALMLDWACMLAGEYKDNGYVNLSDDEFLDMMTMVKSCFEACVEYDDDELIDMLEAYIETKIPFKCKSGIGKTNVRYCSILLDYLESVAPKGAKTRWYEQKGRIAEHRIDKLIDGFSK